VSSSSSPGGSLSASASGLGGKRKAPFNSIYCGAFSDSIRNRLILNKIYEHGISVKLDSVEVDAEDIRRVINNSYKQWPEFSKGDTVQSDRDPEFFSLNEIHRKLQKIEDHAQAQAQSLAASISSSDQAAVVDVLDG
jgi:hypothetical protein